MLWGYLLFAPLLHAIFFLRGNGTLTVRRSVIRA
jgi:hypothetical protein